MSHHHLLPPTITDITLINSIVSSLPTRDAQRRVESMRDGRGEGVGFPSVNEMRLCLVQTRGDINSAIERCFQNRQEKVTSSVCLSVCLPVHPSVRLSVCLSVCLFVRPSIHLSVCLSFTYMYICTMLHLLLLLLLLLFLLLFPSCRSTNCLASLQTSC